eukprot:g5272.t1
MHRSGETSLPLPASSALPVPQIAPTLPPIGLRNATRGSFQEGKLFLGGLDSSTNESTILEYCTQWGKVIDVVVMENRGFGFVTFSDPASAQRFLEAHHHEIDDRQIEAKAAVPRRLGGCAQLTKKMFVGGTGEISDEEFRRHFAKYGDIEDAAIVRKDGVSRGFGFVTFTNVMSVEKCLVEIQVLPNGRRVDIKRAVPREQISNSFFPIPYSPGRPRGLIYSPYGPVEFGYGYGYGMVGGFTPGRGGYELLGNQNYHPRLQTGHGYVPTTSANHPPQ